MMRNNGILSASFQYAKPAASGCTANYRRVLVKVPHISVGERPFGGCVMHCQVESASQCSTAFN